MPIPEASARVGSEKGEIAVSGSTKKVFTLTDVVVDGSTVYDADDFSDIVDEYKGEQVSFADLNRIAASMTRKYREDGYVFSRVVMQPQKLKGGVVHMRAIEGRVANVEVRGDVKDSSALIKEMVEAEDPAMPLSDVALTQQLAANGILLARRTVSKYRGQLRVPPAELRRQH